MAISNSASPGEFNPSGGTTNFGTNGTISSSSNLDWNLGSTFGDNDISRFWGIFSENLTFWDFFLLLISLFVLTAWVLSIVFILWWGLLLILSGGRDEKIKPAINTIRYAIIGIIVTVLSIFLFPILWRLLGLEVERYAQPSRIFDTIENIWDRIFSTSWNSVNYWWSVWSSSSGWFNSNGLNDFPDDFSDL
jgi:hypothetical protein